MTQVEFPQKHNHPRVIKKCLDILKINIPASKVILVAGTNGKGSTCATLQTLLIAAGKNVGFFSSPHLISETERIKFNDENIPDKTLKAIFEKFQMKLLEYQLTYFEHMTLAAAYYFHYEKEIDFAIFEVGLGGTFDATNAIPHDISVITQLGLEHEDILGTGIESIAKNKLGIVHQNNTVFHTKFPDEVSFLAEQTRTRKNACFIEASVPDYFVKKRTDGHPVYYLKNGGYQLNLLGRRAVENTGLSLKIFEYLVPNYERYLPALKNVDWPCRMEQVEYKSRKIFLSGDHNPQGIESLLEILRNFDFEEIHFIIGICSDKNCDEMIRLLCSVKNSHIYLTETPEKTTPINEYSDFVKSKSEFMSNDPIKMLNLSIAKAKDRDLIVVTGSLYLAGEIKRLCNNTDIPKQELHA